MVATLSGVRRGVATVRWPGTTLPTYLSGLGSSSRHKPNTSSRWPRQVCVDRCRSEGGRRQNLPEEG